MKKEITFVFIALAIIISCSFEKTGHDDPGTLFDDSFKVSVNNGYGSGKYKTGDTVHIFCANYLSSQLFSHWNGDTSLLNAPNEWHTWFIMPNRNVSFSGTIKSVPSFTLHFEKIMGRDRLKPVYYYFPKSQKGIVYLLHGTNGNAAHLVSNYEWQQLIKTLVNGHYAVIITEAEQATTGVDMNGDGKLRWTLLPVDTERNVDYANIRIITDAFYHRGLASPSEPRYAIGMSDGGFFSAALSFVYHFNGSVNYCSQGSNYVIDHTTSPILFCMARSDSNPRVGRQGNEDALANCNRLHDRGVCAHLLIKERCPLYPQRFARSGVISESLSEKIFDELRSKGFLDNKNYFKGYVQDFIHAVRQNPAAFPVFCGLTASQKSFVHAQISLSVSDHKMYSDYDAATLSFLNDPCN